MVVVVRRPFAGGFLQNNIRPSRNRRARARQVRNEIQDFRTSSNRGESKRAEPKKVFFPAGGDGRKSSEKRRGMLAW